MALIEHDHNLLYALMFKTSEILEGFQVLGFDPCSSFHIHNPNESTHYWVGHQLDHAK